jgi:hypothetical protein
MFLGWYDPDKKKPARQKLAEAVERYVEKFGHPPAACLTNPTDAAELGAGEPSLAPPGSSSAPPAMAVRAVSYIPRWTFYVGVEDEPEAAIAA